MICAFTGHRPQRLPWGDREQDPRCLALKQMIASAVDLAAARGCRTFLCGMALGCDTYFAEAVLAREGLQLEAVIPCPGQADRWPGPDRARYEKLLLQCSRLTVFEASYSEGCMLRRNRAMVDRADLLISVWDGSSGGTGETVRYARERGVELLSLWL